MAEETRLAELGMECHRNVQNYKFYAITDEDKEVKYG